MEYYHRILTKCLSTYIATETDYSDNTGPSTTHTSETIATTMQPKSHDSTSAQDHLRAKTTDVLDNMVLPRINPRPHPHPHPYRRSVQHTDSQTLSALYATQRSSTKPMPTQDKNVWKKRSRRANRGLRTSSPQRRCHKASKKQFAEHT